MSKQSVDDDLQFDVWYALWRSRIFPVKRGMQGIDWAKIAAGAVVAHLQMCGWELRKGPGIGGHARGTHDPLQQNKQDQTDDESGS